MFSALIIDADPEAARSIQATLKPYGFEFTTTQDANEAMTLARTATPDIIFLRVELPNVSGFSVCNKLRRSDETKYVPLVMYASGVSDDVFNQHRNLKTHADEYIKLPFGHGQLVETVRALIDMPADAGEVGSEVGVDVSALDVDIDDVEEAGRAAPESGLEMREFDEEFAAMSQETGSHKPVRRPEVGLGEETDAAFDALTVDASDDEPSPPPAAETSAPEPEPEVEPEVAATPEPEPQPEPQAEPQAEAEPVAAEPARPEPASPPPPRRATNANVGGGEEDGGEFKAQREVIALKAQLNVKNREILALKEEVESRDRGVLDLRHKNRELLAQIGDIEEKLVTAEEQIITEKERAEAASRDKNTILKREEGLKGRLELAQKKIKDSEEALTGAQAASAASEQRHNGEVAGLQGKLATAERDGTEQRRRADRLEGELASTTAHLDEATTALEQSRARSADLSDAVTRAEAEASELRREIERVRREGEEDRASALEEARGLAEAEKAAALKALGEEQQAEMEFAEGQRRAEVERVRTEGEEALAAVRADIEKLRAQITEAEESATAERERMLRQLSEVRAEAASVAATLTAERDTTMASLERESATLRTTTSDLDSTRSDLESTRASLRAAESDLAARREAARRAEQALAVAMRVLDERAAQ